MSDWWVGVWMRGTNSTHRRLDRSSPSSCRAVWHISMAHTSDGVSTATARHPSSPIQGLRLLLRPATQVRDPGRFES